MHKCICRINKQNYIDVVMSVYNVIEYSNNFSKTSRILWQYCRNEPAWAYDNKKIASCTKANAITDSFKIKEEIKGKTGSNDTKNVEIMVPLKYLSNFLRTREMLLINFKINLDLNLSKNYIMVLWWLLMLLIKL